MKQIHTEQRGSAKARSQEGTDRKTRILVALFNRGKTLSALIDMYRGIYSEILRGLL